MDNTNKRFYLKSLRGRHLVAKQRPIAHWLLQVPLQQ